MAEIWIDNKPIPCPKESPNSRDDRDGEPPIYIVLHSTGGAFAGAISWMMSVLGRVSAHFIVSRRGEYRQLVSIKRIAWHAGAAFYEGRRDLNSCSIGIEMEHVDGEQDWTQEQVRAAEKLCAALCYKLGIKTKNIIGHSDIAWPRGRKVDPMGFPLRKLRAYVQRKLREYGVRV